MDKLDQYFLKYVLGFFDSDRFKLFKKGDILELKGDQIRRVSSGKEVLIPLPESLTIPVMYISAQIDGNGVETWAISGDVWVGQGDYLIYKENYTKEYSSFYYNVNELGEVNLSMTSVLRDNTEITYSDFNGDIKIEAPTENVMTVDDYMEQEKPKQIKTRDTERKRDLSNLAYTLKKHYKENNQYPISNGLEKTNDKNCVLWDALIPVKIPTDPLDPEFYYTYKSDGRSYELTARLENLEDEDCVMENGICLYSLKGGSPAPDYKKIEETKDKCKGSLEITDEKCVDGKLEMKVKVSTAGECPIVSFIANYADNKKKIAEFSSLGDNVYSVVLDNCNKVEKLIVSGEGGFMIN